MHLRPRAYHSSPGPGPAVGRQPPSRSPVTLRLMRRRPPAPAVPGRLKGDTRCSPAGGTATGSPPRPGLARGTPHPAERPPPSRGCYRALGTSTGPSTPPPAKACPLYFSPMPERGNGHGPAPARGKGCKRGHSDAARPASPAAGTPHPPRPAGRRCRKGTGDRREAGPATSAGAGTAAGARGQEAVGVFPTDGGGLRG